MNTRAGQYAESFGIKQKGMSGMPSELMNSILTNSAMRIAGQGKSDMDNAGMRMHGSGMQYSGVAEQKVPTEIKSNMFSQYLDMHTKLNEENERYKMQNQSMWLSVLQHEDNYELEQRRIESQEKDFFDTITTIGSLLVAI